MATLTRTYKPDPVVVSIIKNLNNILVEILPRPCMLVSTGWILAGLGIPVFMVMELIPATLALGFVGFGLVSTGGVLGLIFCGEI